MKKTLFGILLALFAVIFLFCGWKLYQYYHAYHQAETEYNEIQKDALSSEEEGKIDFQELRKINKDVVGWVRAEGTKID